MLPKSFITSTLIISAICGLLIFTLPTPQPSSDAVNGAENSEENIDLSSLAITNVRILNGETLSSATSLLVRHGVIEKIGPQLDLEGISNKVDAENGVLISGLIDAHTHTYGRARADSIRFGVTSTLDMATHFSQLSSMQQERNSVDKTDQSDLYSAGMLATAEKGHGTQFGMQVETLKGPVQAKAWVAQRMSEGSDYIKLVYMPYQSYFGSLDLATATAIIDAAHDENLLVVAHISSQKAALELLKADIDGLVHIFADSIVTDEFIDLAREKSLFVIPTLAVLASANDKKFGQTLAEHTRVSPYLSDAQKNSLTAEFPGSTEGTLDQFDFETASKNVGLLHQAGITILAGSDAPNPGVAPGVSLHQELQLLVDAGMRPVDAIAAGSSIPAIRFGIESRGVIEVGFRADFLLLENNPLENISHTLGMVKIYKNGYQVEQMNSVTIESTKLTQANMGNFDTNLDVEGALQWLATDDAVMGGNSQAKVQHAQDATDPSNGAMLVEVNVDTAFPFPWAGAYLSDNPTNPSVFNISHYKQIRFNARGSVGRYRVMLFNPASAGPPPTLSFDISEKWETITLDLDDFSGFNQEQLSGLAIVAGPSSGSFTFWLDNVELLN